MIINNNNKILMMSERHVSVLLSVSERHNHAAEVGQVRVEEPQQEAHLEDNNHNVDIVDNVDNIDISTDPRDEEHDPGDGDPQRGVLPLQPEPLVLGAAVPG